MPSWVSGRLRPPADAPVTGEDTHELVRTGPVVVEQILSAASTEPVDYLEEHDEWVVVLAGAATLGVGAELLQLTPGDWVLLPAGTPHRVTETQAGTSWLAVHVGSRRGVPDTPEGSPGSE